MLRGDRGVRGANDHVERLRLGCNGYRERRDDFRQDCLMRGANTAGVDGPSSRSYNGLGGEGWWGLKKEGFIMIEGKITFFSLKENSSPHKSTIPP